MIVAGFIVEVSIVLLIVDVAAQKIIVVPPFLPIRANLLESIVLAGEWVAGGICREFAKAFIIKGTGLLPPIHHLGLSQVMVGANQGTYTPS